MSAITIDSEKTTTPELGAPQPRGERTAVSQRARKTRY
jgi:hypothetical protein